jgi:4-amino-4-deoxy-L-arabinose transferase-like glycosyltransferase
MAALAFLVAGAALVATAFLGAATLRLRGASFAVGSYVLGWAAVVVLGEALSLLDVVGRAGYVTGGLLLLGATAVAWQTRGRPLPRRPQRRWALLREHPQLTALGVVVAAAVGYQLFLVVATPPNNYDSLTYHLARVAAWLQQGHAGYYDAATARANAFPGNAELGILWTVALLGRDTLAALPQLVAELGLLAGVYGIGRRLGFARPAALFAALLTATLSQVALQSVTTQNDLVAASLVAAALYFVLGRARHELPLAGLAAALAVGTKLTGLLALPILVLAAVLVLPRRRIFELTAAGAVAFLGFGAFWYVQNTARTHHPLGVVPEADPYRADHSPRSIWSTAAKVSWRFVDFSGTKPPDGLLTGLSNAGADLFSAADVDTFGYGPTPPTGSSEDTSYFGPLGFLLLLPLSAAFLLAWLARRTSRARGAVAAALPLFLLAVALTQNYNQWLGRFMIIPAAVVMSLAAWLYDRRLRLLTMLASIVGVATLVGTHVHNIAKPVGLAGSTPIWSMARGDAQALNAGAYRCVASLVNSLPADATIGAVLDPNAPEYLLYGPKLGRRLVELHRHAISPRLRWIVVSPDAKAYPAHGWQVEEAPGGWRVLSRDGTPQVVSSVDDGCASRRSQELRAERRSRAPAGADRRQALRSD